MNQATGMVRQGGKIMARADPAPFVCRKVTTHATGSPWHLAFVTSPTTTGTATAYLIPHFFEDGIAEQYEVVLGAAYPDGGLPPGQTYHAAGPTEGGWPVVAVRDSKDSCDRFVSETLMPTLSQVSGGFSGLPQQRSSEIVNLVTA
jgi:hypothetical protein